MSETRLHPDDWAGAISDTDGRQLLVAGPGTGKTEFLVRRVRHLVDTGLAKPSEVVVLSFSRRAGRRLKERIESAADPAAVPLDVTTFHSLAVRILETASGGDRPIPLTTPEQVGLVREVLAGDDAEKWPAIYRGILDSPAFSAEVADFLLRCSERLLTPKDLEERARDVPDWRGLPGLYHRYLDQLTAKGRTDYGVLLADAVAILEGEAGRRLASGYRFVVVDEYQDTTPAQARMAELLASTHGNLTVAGDPYQSIFSFRGAEVGNIAAFSDLAPTKRIILDRSFRVPEAIMDAALRIVSTGDLPGSAGPVQPAEHGGRSEAYVFDQETAEAEWIAREVEELVRVEGVNPADIAVVVRSKRELVSELSRALERRSLPHDPPHSRLVDHPAVRLVHDVVAVAISSEADAPADVAGSYRAMRRLLLGPLVGMSIGQEREMARERSREEIPWADLLARHLPERPGMVGLVADPTWATDIGAADGFWELWTRLEGIAEIVTDPARQEWRRAWTAFGQMVGRQAERDPSVTLARFFELVDEDDFEATPLISHRGAGERITLTTLHQAKGLQFDVVFIANAVEGVFPDLRRSRRMLRPELLSTHRAGSGQAPHMFQLQEEMRLAYTAMTRARRRVVWTATQAGVDQGERRPSRFLMAAAGEVSPGAPTARDGEPITIREAETDLRRSLLDVASGPALRLAAARVLGAPIRPWWDPATFAGAVEPGPDRPILSESFRLSPSQASSYDQCPRRYVLERRLRLGDSTSVYAHFGELAHEILELAEGEIAGTDQRHADLERVFELVDQVWERADFGSDQLNEAWRAKAIAMLTKLYENWPGKGPPVDVELAVESVIDGVQWVGLVDRVEMGPEGLRIVDYKTGKQPPTVDDAAESIQLGFYAKAVEALHGPVVASEMWFPRSSTKGVTKRSLAMHLLDGVVEKMVTITREIADEKWDPRVGGHCTRCPVRRSCPAWPEGKGAFLS